MRPFWYFNVSVWSDDKSFALQSWAWRVFLLHTLRTARHTQTAPVSVWGCLGVSVGVCCRLLTSWFPWRCLEVSGVCLGGVYGYLSDIHGNPRCLNVFGGYLGSPSLQYGAVTLLWHSPEKHNFFHLTILTHQNIQMSIYKVDKNHWVLWLFCFLVPVRKILKNTVALDHPVPRTVLVL